MLFKEIRQAIRLLLNNPGFTAIAALSLALGIGANSAIFSLADAILLRPLPVPQPSHVLASPRKLLPPRGTAFPILSTAIFATKTNRSKVWWPSSSRWALRVHPRRCRRCAWARWSPTISSRCWMSSRPGRAFLADEGKVPGRDAIAILSYHFWETEFGRDPSAVGRTVRMNGIDFTIVRRRSERLHRHRSVDSPLLLRAAVHGAAAGLERS